jgi:hypothetical protein
MENKLEAVAVKLGVKEKVGVRLSRGSEYINLYIDGLYCGDLKVSLREGKYILTVFHPKNRVSNYTDLELDPTGREEFLGNRSEAFKFFDFDWTV